MWPALFLSAASALSAAGDPPQVTPQAPPKGTPATEKARAEKQKREEKERAAEDKRARAAWERLTDAEQRDAIDYLTLACSEARTFQGSLIQFATGLLERERAAWPEVRAPEPYDPAVHAPAGIVKRHEIALDARERLALQKRIDARAPARRIASAWSYDYATRSLQRTPDWDRPARAFANALAGFAPDLDLAEALVERALDDGSQQKALGAFAHTYTDREGGAFTGITLYDAWSSGAEIEMPDIDVLGIVHDVFGEWQRWIAPIPPSEHAGLYEQIGDVYQAAYRHKSLRCALARTYLEGAAVLRDGYDPSLDNLHALWEANASTPATLAAKLPRPAAWSEFLGSWTAYCQKDGDVYQKGVHRRATLTQDELAVRATMLRVLTEFGAYERTEKPRPKASDAPKDSPKDRPKDSGAPTPR